MNENVIDQSKPDSALVGILKSADISQTLSDRLITEFAPFWFQSAPILEAAGKLAVTDEAQVKEMQQARTLRLSVRQIRVDAEKKRKALKEESLRTGKAIDAVNAALLLRLEPLETRLTEMEEFAERAAQKRAEQRKTVRVAELTALGVNTTYLDLMKMPEDDYTKLVQETKHKLEAERVRVAEEAERRRVEQERSEKERAEQAARMAAENERLRQEKEAAEKQAALERANAAAARAEAERVAAEERAKANAERIEADRVAADERRKIEAELAKAREDAARLERENREREAAAAAERALVEAAAKKAANAPDVAKLRELARSIAAMPVPELSNSPEAQAVRADVCAKIIAMSNWVVKQADTLA